MVIPFEEVWLWNRKVLRWSPHAFIRPSPIVTDTPRYGTRPEHNWTALLITHDVREAILLSDRVVVLSPRPAAVSLILDVDLQKPRGIDVLTSPRFLELERTLLQTLGS